MCDTNYSITVKTSSSRQIESIMIGDQKCLTAEEGSLFRLEATNGSDCPCSIAITIGVTYLGTWLAQPKSFVRVEMENEKKLRFEGHFKHIAEYFITEVLPTESSIVAVFVPIRSTVIRCVPNNTCLSDVSRCSREIDWGEQVDIEVPVLLR